MKKYFLITILFLIVSLATFLRFYQLDKSPASLNWDEVTVGYNAWTILNWQKDEWGKTLPLVFKSFEDYKHPVHIYFTAATVAIFGLNELGVRASSALFGVINVIVIFFLAREFFKSSWAGLFASLFLSVSPYAIHFSRFNHELNFAIFFFMLGVYFILLGLSKKNYLVALGFAFLGLDLLTYHSAKVITPIFLIILVALNIKSLWKIKKIFFVGICSFLFFVILHLIEPQLMGLARYAQTSSKEAKTVSLMLVKYSKHWDFDYLFVKGDPNPRLSSQLGMFHRIDIVFIAVGIIFLIWSMLVKRKKEHIMVLVLLLLAPLPAILSSEVPHASRAMFMLPAWYLVTSFGAFTLINTFKNRALQVLIFISTLVALSPYTYSQFENYEKYSDRYAIEWQYGMKDIVNYVRANKETYDEIFMTDVFNQPYIFYLFYLKYPLPNYLRSVSYNNGKYRPSNLIIGFDKYNFGNWDPIESLPIPGVLYVVNPSAYSGLRHINSFETVKKIQYPNGTDAFYLVTAKNHEEN